MGLFAKQRTRCSVCTCMFDESGRECRPALPCAGRPHRECRNGAQVRILQNIQAHLKHAFWTIMLKTRILRLKTSAK